MASGLATLTVAQLSAWVEQVLPLTRTGQVNQRLRRLAIADPQRFAIYISPESGPPLRQGDTDQIFPLMSVIKPFLLLYLLEQFGTEQVFEWVGATPSEAPFNSLAQLQADGGFPRNPMINSGAIALAGRLPGASGAEACEHLRQWLNQQAQCQFQLDQGLLTSLAEAGREPNLALVRELTARGRLPDPHQALDTYEHLCCLAGRVGDLAHLGRLMALGDTIAYEHRHRVNALMLTCGLYSASAHYALRVGLPMKSGISGALLAVVPGQGGIAIYTPILDAIGNPIAALALMETLSRTLKLSIFA